MHLQCSSVLAVLLWPCSVQYRALLLYRLLLLARLCGHTLYYLHILDVNCLVASPRMLMSLFMTMSIEALANSIRFFKLHIFQYGSSSIYSSLFINCCVYGNVVSTTNLNYNRTQNDRNRFFKVGERLWWSDGRGNSMEDYPRTNSSPEYSTLNLYS